MGTIFEMLHDWYSVGISSRIVIVYVRYTHTEQGMKSSVLLLPVKTSSEGPPKRMGRGKGWGCGVQGWRNKHGQGGGPLGVQQCFCFVTTNVTIGFSATRKPKYSGEKNSS